MIKRNDGLCNSHGSCYLLDLKHDSFRYRDFLPLSPMLRKPCPTLLKRAWWIWFLLYDILRFLVLNLFGCFLKCSLMYWIHYQHMIRFFWIQHFLCSSRLFLRNARSLIIFSSLCVLNLRCFETRNCMI